MIHKICIILFLSFITLSAQVSKNQSEMKTEASAYDETISLLKKAIQEDQNNFELHCILAHYYEMDNQVNKAVSTWKSCKNYSNDDAMIHEAIHHIKRLKEVDR